MQYGTYFETSVSAFVTFVDRDLTTVGNLEDEDSCLFAYPPLLTESELAPPYSNTAYVTQQMTSEDLIAAQKVDFLNDDYMIILQCCRGGDAEPIVAFRFKRVPIYDSVEDEIDSFNAENSSSDCYAKTLSFNDELTDFVMVSNGTFYFDLRFETTFGSEQTSACDYFDDMP